MKQHTLIAAFACLTLSACQPGNSQTTGQGNTNTITLGGTGFIPIDSANKMISSYLGSVSTDDSDLHSLIFNADSLRRMLNDTSDGQIAYVKIMFAHSLDYINHGGQNKACGYKSGAFTVVVSGFDNHGNYLYYPEGRVMNIARPCPPSCPGDGTASSDLLTTATN